MTGPGVIVGARIGPFHGGMDADFIRRFALATRDPSAMTRSGHAVPAAAIVTQIWDAQEAGRTAFLSPELQAAGGVHGGHDIVLHRPIVPGEALRTFVEGHGSRPAGRNSLVTLRYTSFDADERVVAEQWWTTVYLGVTCETAGETAPDHSFPSPARNRPVGRYETLIDAEMPRRYAEVSGDWYAHHFDLEAARATGFDRLFLQGLCTLAVCAQGVVDLVADGDPRRVRRMAVRFSAPAFLGEHVRVDVFDAGTDAYAFEAKSSGTTVISHGRVELR